LDASVCKAKLKIQPSLTLKPPAAEAKSAFKSAVLAHIKQTNPCKPKETSCTTTRPHPTWSTNGQFFSTESDS
ncbi:hypothetical protein NVV30_07975, partial [Pseudomonas syringae]|uniref:hypothetical protein n=1 Tax=Pseudomonas syringae TaxID=317 RepID=UPI00215B1CF7